MVPNYLRRILILFLCFIFLVTVVSATDNDNNQSDNFFENIWVITIIGGIIAGVIVTYISRWFLISKGNKEYFQKVKISNQAIIFAIESSMTLEYIPTREMIQSIINANAYENDVDVKDLYSINQIIDELIKQVTSSNFISIENKGIYCEKLLKLKEEINKKDLDIEIEAYKKKKESVYESNVNKRASNLIGIITTVLLLFTMFTVERSLFFIDSFVFIDLILFFLLFMGLIIGIIAIYTAISSKNYISGDRAEKKPEENLKEDNN